MRLIIGIGQNTYNTTDDLTKHLIFGEFYNVLGT